MKKQNKHFYHSVITLESLFVELHRHDLAEKEKEELMILAERSLHHSILDLVLSELSESDKHLFLKHHALENHPEIWNLLNAKVENIEEKIKKTATEVSQKLRKNLKK